MEEVFIFSKEWFGDIMGFLALFGIVIDFLPIKISPVKWLFKRFGGYINTDLEKKIVDIQKRVDELSETFDKKISELQLQRDIDEIDRIRNEILSFANSCHNKQDHLPDEFKHIVSLNDKYHDILKRTNGVNGVLDAEFGFIMEYYRNTRLNKNLPL